MNYLDELSEARFTTTPWASEQELTLDGKKVYTSESLRENVKKIAKKFLPKSFKLISTLVDDGRLIPIFLTKNLKNYLISRKKIKTGSLGTTRGNKIYIFLDRFYSLLKLSSINEKKLSVIISHELVHLSDHKNPKRFFQINYKIFFDFYVEFFSNYLAVDYKFIKTETISGIIKRIYNSHKKGLINFREIYYSVFNSLEKKSSYENKEFQEMYDEFINYLDTQYVSFSHSVPTKIWEAGRLAYIKISGGNNETLAQEFWNPAEIIAVLSEINPNSTNIIKSMNLLK